jgi:glycosyltransferase involved in cell wall biosynthesis
MNQIALNARFYAHRPTGMQRYAIEVSERFSQYLDPVRPVDPLRGAVGHLWEQCYLPSAVRGRLLWSPNNTGPLAVTRQVCTIHDLIPLDHPEWFNRRFAAWYAWLLPRLAQRVQHIIAISEFTRQRVMDLLRVPSSKITVIPNGVDGRFYPRSAEEIERMRQALGIGDLRYILCVGSLEPRKNLRGLFNAWRIAQTSIDDDIHLVVAGARGSARVFAASSIREVPPRVHYTGYVSDEHLPALYSGALAMIYPSLYEGFGLPPLEAMACGTAAVTSNNSSIPEVVGDGAVLVDARDDSSIADGIVRVLRDGSLREELNKIGVQRVARFQWDSTAKQTLEVLLRELA